MPSPSRFPTKPTSDSMLCDLINVQHAVYMSGVQCAPVQWSICCMKCTDADTGAGSCSGALCSVQCAVCSLQCPACQRQRFSPVNQMSRTNVLFLILCFQKHIASNHF